MEIKLNLESTYEWNINGAIEKAISEGFEIIRSDNNTILLDIDNPESMERFHYFYEKIYDSFDLRVSKTWKSRHGNYHIVIECSISMPFPNRVAIAACLGSDPIREALAIRMYMDGINEPSVLFKPPELNNEIRK